MENWERSEFDLSDDELASLLMRAPSASKLSEMHDEFYEDTKTALQRNVAFRAVSGTLSGGVAGLLFGASLRRLRTS
jgi:hypothetical protein